MGCSRWPGAVLSLRLSLIALAARHRERSFPAHTHGQPAQPTTLAHYLLAVIEELERDFARLLEAYARVNRCPLGACAITGTGFAIGRDRTSALLGFAAPTGNTYGSIASVDYLLESGRGHLGDARRPRALRAGPAALVHARDGLPAAADGFVQVSSIMPQKRNPVALEHARALASKGVAEASGHRAGVHNTPFGDIVDTEDDLQPLVASAFRDAARAVTLARGGRGQCGIRHRSDAEHERPKDGSRSRSWPTRSRASMDCRFRWRTELRPRSSWRSIAHLTPIGLTCSPTSPAPRGTTFVSAPPISIGRSTR